MRIARACVGERVHCGWVVGRGMSRRVVGTTWVVIWEEEVNTEDKLVATSVKGLI